MGKGPRGINGRVVGKGPKGPVAPDSSDTKIPSRTRGTKGMVNVKVKVWLMLKSGYVHSVNMTNEFWCRISTSATESAPLLKSS